MLLAFVLSSTFALCIANPLHKYPYVFLLDVGNEELEKTNTEQLRVSIPGGSLALKYPALGEGDPITHVRVSGIDFGTDLKVNIVQGGPGYKYVVLMFMGNPRVNYDAVVTLQTQTLPTGTEMSMINNKKIGVTENLIPYEISDADREENDEDTVNDTKNIKEYAKKSKEVMQSTSSFYNYAKSEMADSNEDKEEENVSAEESDDNDDSKTEDDEEDEQELLNENNSEFSNQEDREDSDGDQGETEEYESGKAKLYNEQNYYQFVNIPRKDQYKYRINVNDVDNVQPNSNYQDAKRPFGLGFKVYPESFMYDKQYRVKSAYNKEEPVEFEQMYSEDDDKDSKDNDDSNNIDSDYLIAEY